MGSILHINNCLTILFSFSVSSIKYFFVDSSVIFLFEPEMNFCILPVSLKISKFSLSGLILIISNPVSSFIICSFFPLFLDLCKWSFSSISIPSLWTVKYLLTFHWSFIISFGKIFFIFFTMEYSFLSYISFFLKPKRYLKFSLWFLFSILFTPSLLFFHSSTIFNNFFYYITSYTCDCLRTFYLFHIQTLHIFSLVLLLELYSQKYPKFTFLISHAHFLFHIHFVHQSFLPKIVLYFLLL